MKWIGDFKESDIIPYGMILREYGVDRLDIMKYAHDRSNPELKKKDYYEYVIVDAFITELYSYLLVNITKGNNNAGRITYSVLKSDYNFKGGLKVSFLRKRLGDNIYVIE